MNILYACSFPLIGTSGKSLATRKKLAALRRNVDALEVLSTRTRAGLFSKAVQLLVLEFRVTKLLIARRRHFSVFINRGLVGLVSVPLAKLLGVPVVREVHADPLEEARILAKNRRHYWLLWVGAKLHHSLDRSADIRIFNNPLLLDWYRENGWESPWDDFVYNGGTLEDELEPDRSRMETRRRFGLPPDKKLLVFTGSASVWHGIEYLVQLQTEFNRHNDELQIVCGGGPVDASLDPERRLMNITPLDERGCAELIRASDLCLLPVKSVRRSPGSPLKLYDYILNGAYVITQESTLGYSDEVAKHVAGSATDFADPAKARRHILSVLDARRKGAFPPNRGEVPAVSWEARSRQWVAVIERAISET